MALSFDEGVRARPLSIAHGEPLPAEGQPRTLAEGIAQGLAAFPAGRFVFMDHAGGSVSSAYAEVFARARRILGGMRRNGIRPGDKLILYFNRWADFVPTLWAALLGGAVPLPIMQSVWNRGHAMRGPQVFEHLRNILDTPRVISDAVAGEGRWPGLGTAEVVSLATLETGDADGDFFAGSIDEPRLLVLSSGTTAAPNLVTLSARALINRWWPSLPDPEHAATFLAWSPFDHVMGLGLASPNLPTKVHLPTAAFVRSPASWLSAVSQFEVTHCTMTNFGMALVEQAVSAKPGQEWDLSSVRKIGVGAESVSPDVCRRFMAALRPFGLRADSIILGYGLSECGPVVGGSRHFAETHHQSSAPFAVLDRPTRGHSVRIVSSGGDILPEGEDGAVEVKGPTMTLGYYGDEVGTRALFTPDHWIRTGDLGRLDGGQLTVTGREKEIIVIHAKKFACSEIEAVAQSVDGVTLALAVACDGPARNGRTGERGQFAVFVVQSPAAASGPLLRDVRARIAARFGLAPAYLLLIGEEDIPRTATGKVRRLELAGRIAEGTFDDAIASARSLLQRSSSPPAASETERRIASIWAEILEIEDCGLDEDFFELGGDSLSAEILLLAIEQQFGKRLSPELLHQHTTIARLAAFVDGRPLDAPPAVTGNDGAPAKAEGGQQRRKTIARKRDADTLAWSIEISKSRDASLFDRGNAAEFLVAYGNVDAATVALRNLDTMLRQQGLTSPHVMGRLITVTERFRRMGIPQAVRELGDLGQRLLSSSEEAVLWKAPGSGKLLVVFNSMFGDFWLSNPVLHCLIRDNRTNILYLKDPSERIFAGGLKTYGANFDALIAGISATAKDLAVSDVRVMGFSAGGYAALLAAMKLRANAFLGFSVRTDLSPASRLPNSQFASLADRVADDVYLDLEPLLRASGAPRRGILYYGENEHSDAAHAERLARLPHFVVRRLAATLHNTVLTLLAEGEFERTVRKFLA